MYKRHTVIDSPLGELTLAANADALTGLYFPHHWHAPTTDVLGRYIEPGADVLLGHTRKQLHDYLIRK